MHFAGKKGVEEQAYLNQKSAFVTHFVDVVTYILKSISTCITLTIIIYLDI